MTDETKGKITLNIRSVKNGWILTDCTKKNEPKSYVARSMTELKDEVNKLIEEMKCIS